MKVVSHVWTTDISRKWTWVIQVTESDCKVFYQCQSREVYLLNEQFACWQLILGFVKLLVVLRLWRLQLSTVLYQRLRFRLHLADVQSCHREVFLNLLGSDLYAAWLLLKLRYIQLSHKNAQIFCIHQLHHSTRLRVFFQLLQPWNLTILWMTTTACTVALITIPMEEASFQS